MHTHTHRPLRKLSILDALTTSLTFLACACESALIMFDDAQIHGWQSLKLGLFIFLTMEN